MSHIQKVNTQIKSLKALKKAVKQLGLNFEEGVKSFNYYGSSMGQCDHVIRNGSDSKAIGVVSNGDKTFSLSWDPDYLGKARDIIGRDAGALKQEYGVQVAIETAEAQGMYATRYAQADGSVRIECEYA